MLRRHMWVGLVREFSVENPLFRHGTSQALKQSRVYCFQLIPLSVSSFTERTVNGEGDPLK